MPQHSFHVKTDNYPLVSSDDTLVIMHKHQVAPNAVLWIGAHYEATVELRSAANREAVEIAVPFSTLSIPAGGKVKVDLTGTASTLDVVSTVIPTKGQISVTIASMGEFDTYFKQVNVAGS
jgi:hypothetical protein